MNNLVFQENYFMATKLARLINFLNLSNRLEILFNTILLLMEYFDIIQLM